MFFAVVLAKKYMNPSSDIIEVLAGLDYVDLVFTELVTCLDQVIKDGRSSRYMAFPFGCQHSLIRCSRGPAESCANDNRSCLGWISDGSSLVFHQS